LIIFVAKNGQPHQSTMTNEQHNINTPGWRNRNEKRCTLVGLTSDISLSALKIVTGYLGHSSAILADGIHSISDTVTDALVYAMVRLSGKGVDERYRYGRGKYETLAAFLISIILVVVALGLMTEGVQDVWAAIKGETLQRPHTIALIVGIIAVIAKEALYHYTLLQGKKTGSSALKAYAWHHRADALSTTATLLGVAGAMFLGERWRVLDPIAAIAVSVLILILAYRLGRPAVEELLEVSLPQDEQDKISSIVTSTPGVKAFHNLRTRRNGNLRVVDIHVKMDGELTVARSHEITREIERQLSDALGEVLTNIHVEPYHGNNNCEKKHHEQ
jgi:cation diffusion facilitator family transporter